MRLTTVLIFSCIASAAASFLIDTDGRSIGESGRMSTSRYKSNAVVRPLPHFPGILGQPARVTSRERAFRTVAEGEYLWPSVDRLPRTDGDNELGGLSLCPVRLFPTDPRHSDVTPRADEGQETHRQRGKGRRTKATESRESSTGREYRVIYLLVLYCCVCTVL